MLNRIASVGHWAAFTFGSIGPTLGAVVRPSWWGRPFYGVLIGGLPLAVVAGLALGIVVWVHTRGVLARTGTGAVEFLPTFLAAAVLLELAPLGAGLIVAARTGASLAAELAAMRVGEQLDALELLGVSARRRLIGPRILACILAAPLLYVVIAAVALGGGFVAELVAGQTTWLKYSRAAMGDLRLIDVVPAAMKTFAFGALVGVTGCFAGVAAKDGSEGVGQAATHGVVASVLLVLAADVFLVSLIRVLFG